MRHSWNLSSGNSKKFSQGIFFLKHQVSLRHSWNQSSGNCKKFSQIYSLWKFRLVWGTFEISSLVCFLEDDFVSLGLNCPTAALCGEHYTTLHKSLFCDVMQCTAIHYTQPAVLVTRRSDIRVSGRSETTMWPLLLSTSPPSLLYPHPPPPTQRPHSKIYAMTYQKVVNAQAKCDVKTA